MKKEEVKPIKRKAEMASLSREHHDGLMFVLKIRKGIKNNVETKRISKYINWFWLHHLLPHFKKEEEILPHILPADHLLMQQMFAEHSQIKTLVDSINKESDFKTFELLASTVNDHIRFEERVLFNEIQKAADDAQLKYLEQNLKDETVCEKWPDEFWM